MTKPNFLPVCLAITFLLSLAAAPCTAGSGNVFIAPVGSISELSFAGLDGEFVAVARSTQQAIDVFTVDGEACTSIPLAGNTSYVTALAVSDGSVYWYETDKNEYGDLYRYDIATGTQSLLYRIDDAWGSKIARIVADGDHLVWDEGQNGGTLKVHTLSTGNTEVIFSNDQIYGLAIDGDRALFGCKRTDGGTGREIHIYSIDEKEDSVIPESRSEGTWGYGDLSSDLAVWTKTDQVPLSVSATSADFMLTDLASASTVPEYHLDAIRTPRISDSTIFWVEKESSTDDTNGTIRAYDIDTGVCRPLITGVYGLTDVREGYVLWRSKTPYAYQVTQIAGDTPASETTCTQPTTSAQPETSGTPPQSAPLATGAALLALLAAGCGTAVRRRRR